MPVVLIALPIGLVALIALVAHGHKAPKHAAVASGPRYELDRGMPEALVHQVLTALVHEQDAAKLEALARELGANYPLSAGELHARATALKDAQGSEPTASGAEGGPAPHAGAAEPGPDMSEAAKVLQAAMRAQAQETGPVTLDGFAKAIRGQYPMAALILTERAKEIRDALAAANASAPQSPTPANASAAVGGVVGAPAVPAGPHATPALPHPFPVAPVGTAAPGPSMTVPASLAAMGAVPTGGVAAAYVVQAGDSASVIAEHFTHDGKRWPELVAANRGKATSADGNFASLRPGETLTLPSSWPSVPVAHAAMSASAPALEARP